MFQTEVITLQPGKGDPATNPSLRADWSPFAQTPDPITGIMAHTPDPHAYHDTGDGRTMLPRSTRHYGSQGFSTRPGLLNIDPTDPVKGTGGFTVDVEQVTKQAANEAARLSGGNPLMAWQLAAKSLETPVLADQTTPRVAPAGQTGYVVPAATPGGSQVIPTQMAPNQGPPAAAALSGGQPVMGTIQNPAVKPPGPAMPQQQPVQSGVVPPQPQPMPMVQAPQQPTQPQQQAPPPQPAQQAPAPWQQPYYPPQPMPQPMPQAMPQPDPVQVAMVQALQAITEKLAHPQAPVAPTPAQRHLEELNLEQNAHRIMRDNNIDFEAEKRAMAEERRQMSRQRHAPQEEMVEEGVPIPEGTGLDFLTDPPSAPKIQVMFDLGRGGQHLKRYHHVAVTGFWLTLIYDSRFEGDQFIPPIGGEGDPPITIRFPQSAKTVKAMVPNGSNQRIGCMDLINFVIIGEDETQQTTAPTLGDFGQLGQDIQQMTNDLGVM